jgi:hypothetical protein
MAMATSMIATTSTDREEGREENVFCFITVGSVCELVSARVEY